MDETATEVGARLAAQTRWLQLLLIHLAGRRVRARVDVDDLVQEVFLRVLGASEPPPPGDALRPYLARLARNAVIDTVRQLRAAKRDGREQRFVHSDGSLPGARASQIPGLGPGPATLAAQSDEHRTLLAAFERLSTEHRRVIGLRQLEGLSAAAAAARMGRSETAVHSLYRRALTAWSVAAEAGGAGGSGP